MDKSNDARLVPRWVWIALLVLVLLVLLAGALATSLTPEHTR